MVRLPCLTISVSFRICSLSAYTGIAQGKILRAEPLGLKRWIWGFQIWDLGRQIAGIRYLSWIGSRLMQMHPKRTCLLAKQFFLGPVAEVSRYLQTANAANGETIRRIHAIDQLPSLMYSNPQKDRNVGHLKNMEETSSRMKLLAWTARFFRSHSAFSSTSHAQGVVARPCQRHGGQRLLWREVGQERRKSERNSELDCLLAEPALAAAGSRFVWYLFGCLMVFCANPYRPGWGW